MVFQHFLFFLTLRYFQSNKITEITRVRMTADGGRPAACGGVARGGAHAGHYRDCRAPPRLAGRAAAEGGAAAGAGHLRVPRTLGGECAAWGHWFLDLQLYI